jgi:YidC/Oxa1 family membrane protein insertase
MDRNSIIGLVLIGGILIMFSVWNSPNKKEMELARRNADSLAMVQERAQQAEKAKAAEIKNDTVKVNNVEKQKNLADNYGDFASAVEGQKEIYTIENDLLKLCVSTKGGRPYSVELKDYKTFDQKPLILFDGDSTVFGINFYTSNNRLISTNELFYKPVLAEKSVVLTKNDTSKSLAMRLYAGSNRYLEYVYTVKNGSYKVDFKMNFVNLDSIISSNTNSIDLNWSTYIRAQEKEKQNENTYTDISYKFSQEEVEKLELSGKDAEKSENLRNKVKWIAYKQQFFSNVIIADASFENATLTLTSIKDTSRFLKVLKTEAGLPFIRSKNQSIGLAFYFGPNHYQTLKKFNLDLEELVTLGSWIVKWINRFLIIPVFNFLNQFIFNYGIIILLLTIFIKLLLFPLTYKSYLSMAKMRVLKPQIDEINERIPADKPMDRQQATMQLYRKVGVSPLGGCLPMLLQFPILIAMFRFFPSSIELRQEGFLWATDLSTYDAIITWSGNIPIITEYFGNHISLFNILMTITTIITMRASNQANASQQQIPGMQVMMYIMPVIFMFVLNRFSSGLTYYYFLANLITIIQNEIFKRSIDEAKLLHQLNENKKKPVKKSSFQAKLEEAARKRGYKTK